MRMAWVLGWAVPEGWFAPIARDVFPQAEHFFLGARADSVDRLEALGSCDEIVGYSLGAQVLLASASRVAILGRVTLLAPIFAFAREENLGGRASRTQVKQLARWLRREPGPALSDFYQRAGLDVPLSLAPTSAVELEWGLERLANERVEPPLPNAWSAWCGTDDPLLDAVRLHALDARIATAGGATHHPAGLLRAWTEAAR